MERHERQVFLDKVMRDGFVAEYRGVRVTKSGKRFWIERATVWQLMDADGLVHGRDDSGSTAARRARMNATIDWHARRVAARCPANGRPPDGRERSDNKTVIEASPSGKRANRRMNPTLHHIDGERMSGLICGREHAIIER